MFRLFVILLFCLVSCKQYDKNTDIFFNLLAREEYLKEIEPNRTFNPASAMFISTLPDYIGNLQSNDQISDFEIIKNGLGYSKRYKNKAVDNGYWVDVFAYHSGLAKIPENIDNNIVKQAYNSEKQYILLNHSNSKILENNIISFTTQNGKNIKMYETIYEYWDIQNNTKMKTFLYFGVMQDTFYKIRITYKIDEREPYIYKDKEYFLKDLGYYLTDGISLKDFNEFKKNNSLNLTKIERIKKL